MIWTLFSNLSKIEIIYRMEMHVYFYILAIIYISIKNEIVR